MDEEEYQPEPEPEHQCEGLKCDCKLGMTSSFQSAGQEASTLYGTGMDNWINFPYPGDDDEKKAGVGYGVAYGSVVLPTFNKNGQ